MAINRSGNKSNDVPGKLDNLLYEAFSYQVIAAKYEDAFKGVKADVVKYLDKNDDGFEVDLGKGFAHQCGTVIYAQRSNWKFDTDKIIELVKGGKVTLETLVNLASFNAEKLKTAIGEKEFGGLAANSPTEYLTLRASQEFKNEADEKFAASLPTKTEKATDAPAAKAPAKAKAKKAAPAQDDAPVASSLEKIRAAKGKKPKNASDDLDSILKE